MVSPILEITDRKFFYSLVCKFKVSQGASLCCNQLCPSLVSGDGFISELAFDLFISLADHTGTVDNVKLNGPVAAVDLLHKSVSVIQIIFKFSL